MTLISFRYTLTMYLCNDGDAVQQQNLANTVTNIIGAGVQQQQQYATGNIENNEMIFQQQEQQRRYLYEQYYAQVVSLCGFVFSLLVFDYDLQLSFILDILRSTFYCVDLTMEGSTVVIFKLGVVVLLFILYYLFKYSIFFFMVF